MKKIYLFLLVAISACVMGACGNAVVEKIGQLVVEATEQTKVATSPEEISEIALNLQAEMDAIAAESGNLVSFGKSVDAALATYQEVAAAKLAEFGIELE